MDPNNSALPFCADDLWDYGLTWNTTNPDFTSCFQETVLVYLPLAVLVLLTPVQIHSIWTSRSRLIPWSLINLTRTFLNVVLIILPLVDLGFEVRLDIPVHTVYIVAACLRAVSYIAALVLHLLCLRYGLVSSAALSVFWLVAAVCGGVTFRSVLMSPLFVIAEDATPVLPFLTYTIQYPLVFAIFFLTFFADPHPRFVNIDGKDSGNKVYCKEVYHAT